MSALERNNLRYVGASLTWVCSAAWGGWVSQGERERRPPPDPPDSPDFPTSSGRDIDLDRPRLRFLAQRQPHGQNAAFVLRRHFGGAHGLRQRERAAERPVPPFDGMELPSLHVAGQLLP